ncbi:MAG: N-acetylmuramoyl-L-alanine amidase [Anaerolineae bacterium]
MGERARREILPGLAAALGLIALAGALVFFTSRPQTLSPSPIETPIATHNPSPTPALLSVGIVSGHWKYDGGAMCPDGVREVDIAHQIATKAVALLEEEGYRVDLLAEFDPALQGYKADALVALHVDSCIPGASGFKVARAWNSFIPEVEDELVNCLYEEYERITGLKPHLESITLDMRGYHAFGEVAPETPAAIIEMGFMADDAELLRHRQDTVAQGVVAGIECFLERSKTP